MKKRILIFTLLILFVLGGLVIYGQYFTAQTGNTTEGKQPGNALNKEKLRDGDVIFQTSLSGQSRAIQLATDSKYSHCGLIYILNNKYLVFEAIQPVKLTPLEEWIARGHRGEFVVKRLKDAEDVLTPAVLEKMKLVADDFIGKNYDYTFEWSDDKIYCSELVWKVYNRATGLEVGQIQKLREFNLTDELVKNKLRERYGDNIPLEEPVISPAAVFNSELLVTVMESEQ